MKESMTKCMTCGIPREQMEEIPWGIWIEDELFSQCKPCRQNEIDEQIKAFQESETDTEFEDLVICPHCGSRHEHDGEDSCFYNEGEHEFYCCDCHNKFKVCTEISYTYSTYKILEDGDTV